MKISRKLPLYFIVFFALASLFGCSNLPLTRKSDSKNVATTTQVNPEDSQMETLVTQSKPVTLFNIYMVALEDNGKSGATVGCGDSLMKVETRAGNPREALEILLGNNNQWYGQSGLYNALYQSNLSISQWENSGDGIEIDLAGDLVLGGVCDNPRVKAQLEATIRQSIQEEPAVLIRINGILLDDYLSGK